MGALLIVSPLRLRGKSKELISVENRNYIKFKLYPEEVYECWASVNDRIKVLD